MDRVIIAFSLLVVAGSCTSDSPDALFDIGDPCRSLYSPCVDDANVQRCEDEVWAIASCDTVCAELGPAYVAKGCDDGCTCELVDPDGCTPGESVCVGEDEVGVCDDAQTMVSSDCASVCAAVGLTSLGCVATEGDGPRDHPASCWCSAEGTACDPNAAPTCVGQTVLATCDDGAWTFEDCVQVCGGPAECDPWTTPHECRC